MERKADRVGPCGGDEGDIIFCDVIVFEGFPEPGHLIGTDQLAEHLVDHALGIRPAEAEHIAFRIEPIAQIGPFDKEVPPIRTDERGAVDGHKGFRLAVRETG